MKCHSKERENLGEDKKGNSCNQEATKQCRHGFATCNRHFHGCKNEEKYSITYEVKK